MKTISQSFIFAGIVLTIFAGLFAFSAMDVSAQSSCGSCDTPTGGGGDTPTGGGGGGDDTPTTPTCNLSVDVTEVAEIGDAYRIEWVGGPSSATFFINGTEVSDTGHANFTFNGPNYDRFKMVGNNGGVTCEDEVRIIKTVVAAPTCDAFTVTPSTLPSTGGTVTLDWASTNGTNADIDGQSVAGNGSWDVEVTADTTFTLSLSNTEGSDSCTASVVLEDPVVPAPTCDLFEANPATITAGESTTLTWETTEAVQVFLNNGIGNDNGNLTVDGSFQVTPLTDTTYVLTVIGAQDQTVDCSAPVVVNPVVVDNTPNISIIKRDAVEKDDTQEVSVGGTAQFEIVVTNTGDEDLVNVVVTDPIEPACDRTIGSLAVGASDTYTCNTTNVTAAFTNIANVTGDSVVDGETVVDTDPTQVTVVTVGDTLPICNAFTATPGVLPVGGGTVVLDWELFNTATVVIDNGIGDVTVGSGTIDGTMAGSRTETVTQSTTYTLTATDVTGDTVSCIAPVAVADPAVFTCESNVSFTASDTSITSGQSSTLTWSTTNVDSLTISGVSSTDLSGTESVSPTSDTTYTMTAIQGSETISCPVTIDVSTGGGGGGGGGGSSTPRCELEISAERISAGDEIELTWGSSLATELAIEDNFGNIIVTTDNKLSSDKDELFDGSILLNPTQSTTYTLLVERGSRDRECTVEVEVDDEIVLLEVRDQAPLVSGISLTQVPYTGFEAGPVMTVLFYMLLVTWALYITYVLVMPKARLAMVPVVTGGVKTNEDLMANAEQIRPDVFAPVASAPVVEVPTNLPTANAVSAMPVVTEIPDTNTVENQAHALQALVSSDAARTIAGMVEGGNQAEVVAKIVADAKGVFPLEDGWVVINQSRLAQLIDTSAVKVSPSPTGAGSLAEAIVTGNVVAAYELVGTRPMIALADAATDLDALYRTRKGAAAEVSEMLTEETVNLSDEQIAEMIAALTGAIDGTYSDEASAVKMAIMKAVNIAG